MIKVRRVMYGGAGNVHSLVRAHCCYKQSKAALHGHWLLMLITLINVVFHTP